VTPRERIAVILGIGSGLPARNYLYLAPLVALSAAGVLGRVLIARRETALGLMARMGGDDD
jgi:hypothetical protein